MNWKLKSAFGAFALLLAAQAGAQITLYPREQFRGRAFVADRRIEDFGRYGFDDRASSAVVEHGRWLVCEDAYFEGHCVVLRRGYYDSLRRMGLNNRISSVRRASGREGYAAEAYGYGRRPHDRLFEVPVTSVRAVMGPPEQRCWVERQEVVEQRPNVGGAIAGAIIGGVIGHQIGGHHRDATTAGGAAVGAMIGSQAGDGGTVNRQRDIRRCEHVMSGPPQYWDVTYEFGGLVHHAQLSAPPGPTITVNQDGVPRV